MNRGNLARLISGIILLIMLYHVYVIFFTPHYEDIHMPKPQLEGNSAIFIELYADTECCVEEYTQIRRLVSENNLSFKYYHFPLSYHLYAQKTAQAIECANDQGMFFEYTDIVYHNTEFIGTYYLKRYAAILGMNTKLFINCLDSNAKRSIVGQDYSDALQRGVTRTCTIFADGKKMEFSKLNSTITQLIKKGINS